MDCREALADSEGLEEDNDDDGGGGDMDDLAVVLVEERGYQSRP